MTRGVPLRGIVLTMTVGALTCGCARQRPTKESPTVGAPKSNELALASRSVEGIPSTSRESDASQIFPHSQKASSRISSIDVEKLGDRGLLLAVISLQGLVNRNEPRIFIKQKTTSWLLDYYKSKNYVVSENIYTDPYKLIADHMDGVVLGAVVTDPARPFTINIATNIAGVENRIIITPQMLPSVRTLGITDIKDLRFEPFADAAQAYRWVYETYYPAQRHDLLSVSYYERYNDLRRDYLIAFKVPTFWLPGPSDPEYSQSLEDHVHNILLQAPLNIPILGWWQATEGLHGKKRGISEEDGVKLAGWYGKFMVGDDFVANYSYHAGINIDRKALKQTRSKAVAPYDPQKKYVALTMLDSGQATWYWQSSFPERWWTQKERGEVPISYGIAPALIDLAPGLVEYLYQTATTEDYFFGAMSGMGYAYPFDDYGERAAGTAGAGEKRDQILADYFIKSARLLRAMDLSAVAFYTHPWQPWEESDNELVEKVIVPNIKGIRTLLAGMGRDEGFSAENGSRMFTNGVTLHHTLTRWPPATLIGPDSHADIRKDRPAVKWLADEIRSQSLEGHFIQAMAQSWIYGPRRLKMLRDLLEQEGYVFVTLDSFDEIFRSFLLKKP